MQPFFHFIVLSVQEWQHENRDTKRNWHRNDPEIFLGVLDIPKTDAVVLRGIRILEADEEEEVTETRTAPMKPSGRNTDTMNVNIDIA